MSSRHFIDDPTHLVATALRSLTLTNPHVALDAEHKIVYRRASSYAAPPQVALVAGGGSGHEPSFAGMVGPGMLSAAVAGTLFASPSAEQVRRALASRVDSARGVVVVVMNYTGDVLNFGMAVEKARAAGIPAEMVVVGDDVGVGRAQAGKVGRRGIAGTVLVLKIAGALAARGARLEDVAKVARLAAENIVSVGASLEHVHVPGRAADEEGAVSASGLARGEVEIGMGIHNEPGCEKARLALPQLVARMLAQLLDGSDKDRAFLTVNSNEVVLLINNLGGVSVLEMGGITAEVVAQLRATYSIRPVRVIAGTFMTSLNGMGFSVSLLNVVNTSIEGAPNMVELLDAPSEVTGWSAPVQKTTWEAAAGRGGGEETEREEAAAATETETAQDIKLSGLKHDPSVAKEALTAALKSVIAAEPDVTRYDTVVGDGDCGIGLKRGAEAILKYLDQHPFTGDLVVDVAGIVPVVENTMDGTSGALYAIFLNALTLARSGDVAQAAQASRAAADATKGMKASLGRSVYVGGSGYEEVPDPGAWGLACFFQGLAGN
ncbi:dihydroxyacetone kinase [Beauveria brongniartii RCEF 3172]|uniref:Dihydroxyacetone kinase n=1 Tax=Beauveria brongniartii RCEF 3172 TaxID=1081107 RepID=A0A162HUK6_9HYPO|nr:dihydroxyacetone kinase [Beauveria brongniartii RCEF 3172]